jgi:hypothetical protein
VCCAACGPILGTGVPDLTAARRGVAGASARATHDRRLRDDEAAGSARHPRTGHLRLALAPERQPTQAWEQGAIGEERVGARLDKLQSTGEVLVLHDRRIPGTRQNIDHIVVAPSAIWVVNTKNYRGAFERRDVGGWFRRDDRLFVAGRDRTDLVEAMAGQITAVRDALLPSAPRLRAVLCFTGTEWPFFANPFELDSVLIAWPRALVKQVRTAPSSGIPVHALAERLLSRLPRAHERCV